jgi:cytoskeletal protein CcmA (bactofilin family)
MAYASVIAGSAVIRGNIRGETSLEILGRVEGDVAVSGDLALGPDAVVIGTLSGARVIIGGSVEGDVTGTEAVVVEDTGRVVGDVAAPRIGVSEGAHVRGSVRTEGNSEGRGAAAPARAQRATPQRTASEARSEARASNVAPIDRLAPRPAVAAPAPSQVSQVAVAQAPKAQLPKKAPPPPVIPVPRPGVRARKKLARR